MSLLEKINKDNLPKHLAIIMDGNGRWAKQKGLLRALGHEKGTKSVRTTVETCAKLGIENLTLYAFSTENWNRPKLEVDTLMKLLVNSLKKELTTLEKNNILVYPNPSNGIIHINFKNTLVNKIQVFDVLGRTVYQELLDTSSFESAKTLDLSNNTKGIYILKFYSDKGTSSHKVLIGN